MIDFTDRVGSRLMERTVISRQEFILEYTADLPQYRTTDGMTVGDRVMLAVPCNCGWRFCPGWTMIGVAQLYDHCRRHAKECIVGSRVKLPFRLTPESIQALSAADFGDNARAR